MSINHQTGQTIRQKVFSVSKFDSFKDYMNNQMQLNAQMTKLQENYIS